MAGKIEQSLLLIGKGVMSDYFSSDWLMEFYCPNVGTSPDMMTLLKFLNFDNILVASSRLPTIKFAIPILYFN